MLKFSTTTPFSLQDPPEKILKVRPLVVPPPTSSLREGKIKGREARIVGKALAKAGFYMPCFFDGDITELDQPEADIIMVLPDGEYPIQTTLNDDGIYELDLKDEIVAELSCRCLHSSQSSSSPNSPNFCFLILNTSFTISPVSQTDFRTGS